MTVSTWGLSRDPVRPSASARFDAMGTRAHVVVVGPGAATSLDVAVDRITHLESIWSRFQPSSDIARMNRAGGRPTPVAAETLDLVAHGAAAWHLTNGTFDPTMASQLSDLGYDRTFADLDPAGLTRSDNRAARPALGCGDIQIERGQSKITMPPDISFDPGGIGKGFAADLVTQQLIDDGAWGVLVNLGGDLAVKGLPPQGVEWVVAIREPSISGHRLATTSLRDAGLATSSSAKRRWVNNAGEHHHILDPSNGSSATSEAVLATVIAGQAWWAEVVATSLVVDQHRFETDEAALCVMSNGDVQRRGLFERFEV